MKPRAAIGMVLAVALASGGAACDAPPDDPDYVGYVEADYVYVAAPADGWLVTAPVKEGDEVAVGDLLFQIDDEEQQAEVAEARERLRQAEAEARDLATGARREEIAALEAQLNEATAKLELAEAERRRWTTLVERGTAPKARGDAVTSEHRAALARVRTVAAEIRVARLGGREAALDAAAAARDAAAAALTRAEWRLDQRRVNAGVAGRVEERFHHPGEYLSAGNPVLAILPEGALKVRFFVPQAELSKVTLGTPVQVLADGRAQPVTARVSFIAREAEYTPPVIYSARSREKLVFLIEAQLPATARLRPGQPVDVRLP